MRVLIGQPTHEKGIEQIEKEIKINKGIDFVLIGTSHSDGSYRNCGVSIPISYCIDSNGEPIFISKSDTRTRIVNLNTKEVELAIHL